MFVRGLPYSLKSLKIKQNQLWNGFCTNSCQYRNDARKYYTEVKKKMGLLRGGLAGLGAWKLGGGIISTIIIFIVLYWLLGFFMR